MSADFLSHPHFQALPLSSKSHKLLFPLSIVYGPLALKEEGERMGGGEGRNECGRKGRRGTGGGVR